MGKCITDAFGKVKHWVLSDNDFVYEYSNYERDAYTGRSWVAAMVAKHDSWIKDNAVDLYQAAYDGELDEIEPRDTARAGGTENKLISNYVQIIIDTVKTTTSGDQWPSTPFKDLAVESGITIPDILKALAVFPSDSSDHGGDRFYARNDGEKCFFRGGGWSNTSDAGVFYLNGRHPRSNSDDYVGFRPAYILL